MAKILITPAEACDAWNELKEELGSSDEVILTKGQVDYGQCLADLLSQVDGAILGLERVTAELLRACVKRGETRICML